MISLKALPLISVDLRMISISAGDLIKRSICRRWRGQVTWVMGDSVRTLTIRK